VSRKYATLPRMLRASSARISPCRLAVSIAQMTTGPQARLPGGIAPRENSALLAGLKPPVPGRAGARHAYASQGVLQALHPPLGARHLKDLADDGERVPHRRGRLACRDALIAPGGNLHRLDRGEHSRRKRIAQPGPDAHALLLRSLL
jgi:hypothetical protein